MAFQLNHISPMMLSITYHNLEFGRTRLDFVACGFSSNASFDRFSVRNCSKGVLRNADGCKARKSLCHRREIGPCRLFSTKTPEVFLNGDNISFTACGVDG